MKALIAAGGRATRLRPITWTRNKHLIPLANKPMLANAIEKLAEAGITDIAVNVNPGDTEIRAMFGDGSQYGVTLTYLEQMGGALGIAHVIKNAKEFLGDEPFVFYLGDNIILGSLRRFVDRFQRENLDVLLAFSQVPDPQRFGVPVIENGKLVRVIEKPTQPTSSFAVTGIYLYSSKVFDALVDLKPSARGEFEISDLHTLMIERGAAVGFEEITGWWKDTGTPNDLLEGNALLLQDRKTWGIRNDGVRDPSAVIRGEVSIGKGSVIGKDVIIRGPVAIGDNVTIEHSYIGPFTSIASGVTIHHATVENSIVFAGSTLRECHIVDSLIGERATINKKATLLPHGQRLVVGDNALVEL